jgi:hypothetical protein
MVIALEIIFCHLLALLPQVEAWRLLFSEETVQALVGNNIKLAKSVCFYTNILGAY